MRYPPDQKAKARKSILEAGAKAIKTHGVNGIGVDGIAGLAGVTSGAFYSNFAGKEAMLADVIDSHFGDFMTEPTHGSPSEREQRLTEWLTTYISAEHRADTASGCVLPSLSADIARSGDTVRDTYKRKVVELVATLATEMTGEASDRERRAWSVVALMSGAVAISRAMPDGIEAERLLEASLQSAISLFTPS